MNTIYLDSNDSDDLRRQRLYQGQVYVYSSRPSTRALCDFARELTEEAFGSLNPCEAQHHLPVEKFVAILADLKPRFIHHPRSKVLIQAMLADLGCDMEQTYFDVPRLRTAADGDYLKSGLAYAFHPHRDTWYSAPACQINWWLPVYEFASDSAMALHPPYWDKPLKNGSREYDYGRWNAESRHQAAQHVKTDTRRQPRPEEPVQVDPQVRIVCPPGSVYLFSAAQLHSTVPNTSGKTRISVDFRTVIRNDAAEVVGAAGERGIGLCLKKSAGTR
ncbi:MAG: hypothetical protein K8T25_03780 [Planctomycetia bacterium]|nr:hypothetical protein [Planctomycetia bacterium]